MKSTFKTFLISEARYIGQKDEAWLRDAFIIADNNIERMQSSNEKNFWRDYKKWIKDNQTTLQKWYEDLKSDRNRFIEHSMDLWKGDEHRKRTISGKTWSDATKMIRMRNAETWSGNADQHDYKVYWRLIDNASPEEQDYAIMVSNTMIDLLGGLRDED